MARSKKQRQKGKPPAQQYDSTFKDWIRKEAYQAVPFLIEGARYVRIQEELHMYDPLLENHPKVKRIRAEALSEGLTKGIVEGIAQGEAKGIAEGELLASRKMFVNIVRLRFPSLVELAQKEAAQIDNPATLDLLTQKLVSAPGEEAARWLLAIPGES